MRGDFWPTGCLFPSCYRLWSISPSWLCFPHFNTIRSISFRRVPCVAWYAFCRPGSLNFSRNNECVTMLLVDRCSLKRHVDIFQKKKQNIPHRISSASLCNWSRVCRFAPKPVEMQCTHGNKYSDLLRPDCSLRIYPPACLSVRKSYANVTKR